MVAQAWWRTPPQRAHQPRERARIAEARHTGSVLQWRRHFGWIAPDAQIDHPEAYKHNWRIYVHIQDVASGKPFNAGARVSFFAYCDGDGLGAEEVRPEAEELELAPGPAEAALPDDCGGEAPELLEPPLKRPRNGAPSLSKAAKDEEPAADEIEAAAEEAERPPVESPRLVPKAKGKGRGKGRGKARNPFGGIGAGPDRSKVTRAGRTSTLVWASSEMRGWRPAMEDACCVLLGLDQPLQRHAMFGVFDGHGGSAVSRRAAEELPAQVVAAAAADAGAEAGDLGEGAEDGGVAGRALKAALPAMDAILHAAGDGQPGFLPSLGAGAPIPSDVRNLYALTGSTAVVALLECSDSPEVGRPVRVVVANCGDSRAILCRGGEAIPLTEDHKPDDPEERSRIEKAGGFVGAVGPCMRIDGWGLNLSRALGDFHYKARQDLPVGEQKVSVVPDIRCMDLVEEDEFLLLACDGVFELHNCQEAVDVVRQQLEAQATPEEAVESLVDASCTEDLMSTQGRGSDNVSVMLVLLR